MKSITIETIEKFIYEGEIDSAIDYMLVAIKELVKDGEKMLSDIMLLKSRVSTLHDQSNKGLVKFEDQNIENSKIISSLIEYKDQLEVKIKEHLKDPKNSDVELELLIYANAYANTIKDIPMLEKTLHSKIIEATIKSSMNTFGINNLNLEYKIESIDVVEIGDEFATANVVQITRDKSPSFFRNNMTKASHTFLKENGRWKFYNSIVQEIKYL